MIKLQLLHLFFLSDYKLKCFKTGENNSGGKWLSTAQPPIGWRANENRSIHAADICTDTKTHRKMPTDERVDSHPSLLLLSAKMMSIVRDYRKCNVLLMMT